MGILIAALPLLAGACALGILRAVRPRFRFSWLLSLVCTLVAWIGALLMRAELPGRLDAFLWQSKTSAASFASFTVGATTWPSLLAMVTAAVTVLLSAPGRPRFPAPRTWAACLALSGLGVLALSADSALTLVLFWAALDLAEAGLLLARLDDRSSTTQVPYAFTMRLGSTGLVLLAFVLGDAGSAGAKFGEMQSSASLSLLPAAALLRLGAFAIPWPKSEAAGRDEVDSILQLAAGAASVGFIAQLPAGTGGLPIQIVCAAVSLYAGWMFLRAASFEEARPFWILGVGGLAVAASLLGNPNGAASWGCTMLLVGSPLFVNSVADQWARQTLLVGLWIVSALPFSLTATAWQVPASNGTWIIPFFLASQAMLLAGGFHMAMSRRVNAAMRVEVLALRGLQYSAVGLPILLGILLGLGGWPGALQIGAPLAAVLVMPMAIALALAKRRLPMLNPAPADWIPKWLSAASTSVRREGSQVGGSLQRLAGAITRSMEGEAGIMWGLLFLVLFISVIAGGNR